MVSRGTFRITANFQRNLDSIRAFLAEHDAEPAFDDPLGRLFEIVIPNLESFPQLGIDLLARVPQSKESLLQVERLQRRLGTASVRELTADDYSFFMRCGVQTCTCVRSSIIFSSPSISRDFGAGIERGTFPLLFKESIGAQQAGWRKSGRGRGMLA